MLFRQCRELGIGIIVLDQHPHLLSAAALGNTYTTICLNQKDPNDINKALAPDFELLDQESSKRLIELQSAFLNAEQDSLEEKTVLEEADRIFKALI